MRLKITPLLAVLFFGTITILPGLTIRPADSGFEIASEGQGTCVLDLEGFTVLDGIDTEHAFASGNTLVTYTDYTVRIRPIALIDEYSIPFTQYTSTDSGIEKISGVLRMAPLETKATTTAECVLIQPNPCNTSAQISFNAPGGSVDVRIMDITGKSISALHNGFLAAGKHSLVWSGKDNTGMEAPSGIYFVRIETVQGRTVKRLLLAK